MVCVRLDTNQYLARSFLMAFVSASDAGFSEPFVSERVPLCVLAASLPAPAGVCLALAFGCAIETV